MPRRKDELWQYGQDMGENKIKCNFCEEVFGGGITRFRNHLAKRRLNDVKLCDKVPDHVFEMAKEAIAFKERYKRCKRESGTTGTSIAFGSAESLASSIGFSQQPVDIMINNDDKDSVDLMIFRSMVMNNLSFNLLGNEDFREALLAIARYGPNYVPPSSEMFRTKFLGKLKEQADSYVNDVKKNIEFHGCTIMSGTWMDMRNLPYINCLVACPQGTIYFKSICVEGNIKSGAFIADFISSVIEEIGPKNVVQFVTENGSNYRSAGDILENVYPNIFKTQCAAHCIDLMLEDIDKLPHVKPYMDNARKIVKFLYRYQLVTNLLRVHTNGKELQRPTTKRFATQFICLNSILSEVDALRLMVASAEWRDMPQCKRSEGKEVAKLLLGDEFWDGGKKVIQIVELLIKILRVVDGDGSTMGYLYDGLNHARTTIRSLYPNPSDEDKCMAVLGIIDKHWKDNLQSPLHAAAAYLHPKLFYENIGTQDVEINGSLEKVFIKMAPEGKFKEIIKELIHYHGRDPKIFRGPIAMEFMQTSHPRIWWEFCGNSIPNLQSIAIKILSQPCSASACKHTWSAFEATYLKKRNKLDLERLQDSVYMKVNLHMQKIAKEKLFKDSKPFSLDDIHPFDGWNGENQHASDGDEEDDAPLSFEEFEDA